MKIDATKKLPGEGCKRAWPSLIKMDEAVRKKIDSLFGKPFDMGGQPCEYGSPYYEDNH
jgi:3-polyprenyl-4-hydroxybenzoate decarboxylase